VLGVVQGRDHPALQSAALHADDTSWVAGTPPPAGRYSAKTRYRQADVGCALRLAGDGFSLDFDSAQWAVTPGQSAVLYDGEICLGGGVIDASLQAGEPVQQ
jgi:tRNA-specific 2-thiouridylase